MSPQTRRLLVPVAAFVFGLAVLGLAAILTFAPPRGDGASAAVGGSFRLVDQGGRPVTERDFLGSPHLVFFGFTHCPDICPTTLFQMSEVLRATGDRGKNLRALFVTVDPERDTPAVLKDYLSSFDPRIVALTGDRQAVDGAVKAYKAYARKVPTKDGDYTMEHTSAVYLFDARGRFVRTFNLNRAPEEAAKDLLSAG